MLHVLRSLFGVVQHLRIPPVDKNKPCPMAWGNQHDRMADNGAAAPESIFFGFKLIFSLNLTPIEIQTKRT